MKDTVKRWLTEEGILKSEISDENADWHFLVEFPPDSGQTNNVIKLKGRDAVLVASGITLSDEHYNALHSLPEEKKRSLIYRSLFLNLIIKMDFNNKATESNYFSSNIAEK